MMKKNQIKDWVSFAIAAVVVISLAYYFMFVPGKSAPSAPQAVSGVYAISSGTISDIGTGYSITGSYPEISGMKNSNGFNELVASAMQARIDGFKQYLGDLNFSNLPPEMQKVTSTLIFDYSIESTSTDFVSAMLYSESYLVGMAHPSHAMDSINFDSSLDKNIALSDLFLPGADYLKVISDYSFNDLMNQIKNGTYDSTEGYINQGGGTLPDPQNFQIFSITKDDLIIHFSEYQVGPYASGPADAPIPWKSLSGILSPTGPLNHLF